MDVLLRRSLPRRVEAAGPLFRIMPNQSKITIALGRLLLREAQEKTTVLIQDLEDFASRIDGDSYGKDDEPLNELAEIKVHLTSAATDLREVVAYIRKVDLLDRRRRGPAAEGGLTENDIEMFFILKRSMAGLL